MAVLLQAPYSQFFDANGEPLAGGFVYTYQAGTTTPKATYTDYSEATNAANPIVLDSAGRAQIWVDGSYNFLTTDSLGNTIETTQNYTSYSTGATAAAAFFQSFSGNNSTTSYTLSTAQGTDSKLLMIFVSTPSFSQAFNGNGVLTAFTLTEAVGTNANNLQVFAQIPTATQTFSGNASTTTFTLTGPLINQTATGLNITVGGTYQQPTTAYSVSGATLTFVTAPASGTNNIVVTAPPQAGFELINPSAYTVSGTTLTFTSAPPTGTGNILVQWVNSAPVVLNPNQYTVNGTALTFSTAPPTGTNNILVWAPSSLASASYLILSRGSSSPVASVSASAFANALAYSSNSASASVPACAPSCPPASAPACGPAASAAGCKPGHVLSRSRQLQHTVKITGRPCTERNLAEPTGTSYIPGR